MSYIRQSSTHIGSQVADDSEPGLDLTGPTVSCHRGTKAGAKHASGQAKGLLLSDSGLDFRSTQARQRCML